MLRLARDGIVTGASAATGPASASDVDLAPSIGDAERALLTDPQTSGGLLVACAPGRVEEILALFHAEGFAHAAVIGSHCGGHAAHRGRMNRAGR